MPALVISAARGRPSQKGILPTQLWTSANEGKQGASLRLTVQYVQLLGGRNNEGGSQNEGQPQQQGASSFGYNNNYNTQPAPQAAPVATQDEPMDDLPF